MASPIKIALLGAGSATFSLGMIKDLCLTEGLAGSHVAFMDIDQERLAMVEKLARRYAGELGAPLTFESTTDRRVSLRDADFVINTASVVSHQSSIARRRIGEKHGYYYGRISVGEYNWRNMRFMLDVARDMEEICPDAWLIQAGNPVFEGCTLLTRETSLKVCGLCHGHYGYRRICNTIGIDWRRVTWQAPGLNHNIWLTHFYYEGKDAYPLVDEWIRSKGPEYWDMEVEALPLPPERQGQWTPELERAWDIALSRAAVHMYRMYGLLPIGDTPRSGGWWYHTDIETKRYWYGKPWGGQDTHLSWPLYVQNLERRIAEMTRLANDPKASLVEALGSQKTTEQHVPIIDGLVNNHEGQFQVNVPNRGALAGLPDDVVVEVPAIVNQIGIQPIRVHPLPPKLMLEQIYPNWLSMERQLLAFKTGDKSILLWNVLDNHLTRSYDQALSVLEDILAAEGNEDMNAFFHWPENW
ncbi:MAG: alpha-glucosidase/alpha-galactosidase [Chloroflexi bacterium]|nr:alpha-glucosidase/alpha-galactosidase [Chloroflexota bacterium]